MKWLLLLALILVLALLIWFFFGRPIRKDAKAAHGADEDSPATETTSAPVAAAAVPAEVAVTEPVSEETPADKGPADEAPAAEAPADEAPAAEESVEAPTAEVTEADTAAVVAEAESVTAAAAAADATAEPEAAEPTVDEAETPAPTAEVTAESAPAAEAPAATKGAPYAGAVLPAADGSSSDAAYTIKGSSGKKYHITASPYYGRTKAAVYFDTVESAEAAGFVGASSDFYDRGKKTAAAETEQPLPPASSYGTGSADPLEDGSSPHPAYVVKGNIRKDGAKRYHTSASTAFKRTQAEVWFDSEASAEAAGFEIGFKKKANA
ncbi:hypothetical protein OG984_27550 [Nocardioides sp. NBC_00368]|uniref:sunset domain-containing protein n=1 Tax=Nocardioides sp. NBC_00368 TaxID=2976000 RepID=UPI002E1C95D8